MRLFILIFVTLLLNAYETKIVNVNKNSVILENYVKKGVSGVVLCPFENKEIICARIVSYGKKAKLEIYDNLKNDAFALPQVTPKKGDKVVFAKDYNRVMIIAPNQETYLKIKNKYKNITILHPDIFATFLDDIPTKKDFINFAKKMDIGRFVFVLDKIYEVDAYSFYKIKEYGENKQKYANIFFTTYPKFDVKNKDLIKYYKSLIKEN